MLRIIIGIIVGFIVWLLIFAGIEPIVKAIVPSLTAEQNTNYTGSVPILLQYLTRSIIASIVAGFTASIISLENVKAPLILGIILFSITTTINIIGWSTLPVWYHLSLLGLLIPMTILGGRLKKQELLA